MPHPHALPNHQLARIPESKLHGYALNPDHDSGRDKARVFAAVLGFRQRDHLELAHAIRQALAWAPAIERMHSPHGRVFMVDVAITGPKGSGMVRTGWIIRPGNDVPQLTSAYVKR